MKILLLQFFSAIFMGADYFLTDGHRRVFNSLLMRTAERYQKRLDELILPAKIFIVKWRQLLLIISCGIVFLVVFGRKNAIFEWDLYFLILLSVWVLSAAIFPAIAVNVVVPMLLILPVRFFVWFVWRCPKGSIFGVGYLMLMLSFALRFYESGFMTQ
ncbi:TPA: hypothetical protein ACQQ5N_002777 [Pseudomonas aeruginosa]